jgi:serine/threonine protein kinase
MKVRIIKKLNEGSFTDALDKMIGSDADSITGSNTVPPKGPTRRSPPPRIQRKTKYELILEKKGFNINNIVELGSGMYGSVFKVIDPEGNEVAIKVMHEGGIGDMAMNREMNNYKVTQQAREQSELVAKHFPKVFDMFVEDRYGFIVMELLTNKGAKMNLVNDIFQGREGLVAPTGDTIEQGVYKNVRRRMYTYLTNDTSRNKIIDKLLDGADEKIVNRVKGELTTLPFLQLPAFEAGKNDELYYKILNRMNEAFLYTARDAFLDGFGEIKKEYASNPGLLVFIIKLMEILKEEDMMFYYQSNIGIAMSWTDFIRKGSAIGVHNRPEVSRMDRGGAPAEVGDSIGEAESIRAAIEELEALTGLAGRDMHEGNVMIREYTQDIVIVDLGLFKPRSEVVEEKKKKKKRKKRKKRRSPRRAVYWGGYGYHDYGDYGGDAGGDGGGGGDGKRDDKKKIKVKILKNLEEKCQKGYKTHDTRKTKKMFGKTYRNCVKAEEGKDPAKGTGKKPKGSGRRLYTDEDPSDTVSVKFATVQDIKDTLSKESFKSKSHKRQSQIINLIHQRSRAAYQNAKDPKVKARLKKSFDYATKRKEASKEKTIQMRKNKK